MTQKYQVKVSMKQAAIVETGIVLKQGDFGMQIEIEVLDFDATGTTPQIVFRKAMGAVESTTITVSGNKYTYTFKGTELDTPGKCFCDLKLKNSTTQRISTASFMFKVVADTLDGLAEESSSYSDTIEQIINGYEADIDDIRVETNLRINKDGATISSLDWARGEITSSGDISSSKRLKTISYHSTTECDYITVDSGWQVKPFYYDASDVYQASGVWATGKVTLNTTYPKFRLCFMKTDNTVIDVPDGIHAHEANNTSISEAAALTSTAVRTDIIQSFSDAQKSTARTNIGAASTSDLNTTNSNINRITDIDERVFREKDSPVLFIGKFVNGDGSGDGIDTTVKKRIVNENIVDITNDLYIYAFDTNFSFLIVYYDSEGTKTSSSGWVDAKHIVKGSRIRVIIRRNTEVSSEVANILEFGSAIAYTSELNQLLQDAACLTNTNKYGTYSFLSKLEQGTISSGQEIADNTRCRSGMIDLSGYEKATLQAANGYSFYLTKVFNGTYTTISPSWENSRTFIPEANTFYRFIARDNNNARVYPLSLSEKFSFTVYKIDTEKPEDFISELAADKITEAMSDAITENTSFICMPWISDNHIDPSSKDSLKVTKDTLDCLKLISKELPVDYICHTGDIIDRPYIDGGGTSDVVCESVNKYLDDINKIKPLLVTNGNHDGLDANTYYAWRFYYYMNGKIGADITNRPTDCSYFYKDIPVNKLRLIFLSCPDDPNYYGWNTNQLYWLVNTALATPENYKVMFFCHIATVWTASIGGDPMQNKAALETIITAYSEGTSGSVTLLDGTVLDYAFDTAKTVVAYLCGHTHRDTVVDVGETVPGGQTNNLPCKQIVIAASKFVNGSGGGTVGGTIPSRTMDTESEILFDIILYYPLKHKINLIRCGAGESRSISVN